LLDTSILYSDSYVCIYAYHNIGKYVLKGKKIGIEDIKHHLF
jgi:hypothetical protein